MFGPELIYQTYDCICFLAKISSGAKRDNHIKHYNK
jgi:hypothetical protein